MATDRPWRDAETLIEHYWGEGRTQDEVARQLNCSVTTVRKWMNELDVPTRSRGKTPAFDEAQRTVDERLDPPPDLSVTVHTGTQ